MFPLLKYLYNFRYNIFKKYYKMNQESVNCLELSMPLNFLKTYVANLANLGERNANSTKLGQDCTDWQVQFNSNSHNVSVADASSSTVITGHLKMKPEYMKNNDVYVVFIFSDVMLGIINNKISCNVTNVTKINDVKMEPAVTCEMANSKRTLTHSAVTEPSDKNTVMAVVGESVSGLKRKRGRPRKSEHKSIAKETVSKELALDDTPPGYNLRKIRYKLPPSIIFCERQSIKKQTFEILDDFRSDDENCKQIKTELNVGDESLENSDTFAYIDHSGIPHKEKRKLENGTKCLDYQQSVKDIEHDDCGSDTNIGGNMTQDDKQDIQILTRNEQTLVKRKWQDHPAFRQVPAIMRKKKTLSRNAECKYCKRMFCDYTGVDSHVRKYHQHESDIQDYLSKLKLLKQVRCAYCKDILADRLVYNVHMSNVHAKSEETVCSCGACGKTFKNLFRLKIHVRQIHSHKKSYHLCHLCPSKFLYVATLKQHIEEIHEQIRNVSCDICKKSFYRTSQLNRHKRIHEDDQQMFVCQECGRKFRFHHNLQRHIHVMHTSKTKEERFHCSYCGHGFKQKSSMVAHVRLTHFSMHTFVCVVCKASFQRSKHLSEHMSSVHGDSKFQVDRSRRTSYKYHRTPEDLYYCQFCSSSFFYKAKLVEHMHTAHANAFPHVCKECNQGFLEKSFLTNHIKKAHGIEEEQQQVHTTENEPSDDVIRLKQLLKLNASETGSSDQNNGPASCSVPHDEQFDSVTSRRETTGKTSVIVEVANSCNTVQYVIEGDDKMESEQTAQSVVQDITKLLLAAEQSLHDLTSSEHGNVVSVNSSTEQHSLNNFITIDECPEQNQTMENSVTVDKSIRQAHTLNIVDDSPDVVSEEIIIASSAMEEVEIKT